jgi:hypothetical protein
MAAVYVGQRLTQISQPRLCGLLGMRWISHGIRSIGIVRSHALSGSASLCASRHCR